MLTSGLSRFKNKVIHSNCIQVMQDIPDNSVDSIVTDAPYGIGFMDREWDTFTPKEYQHFCKKWSKECKRVMKPGAHLLSFSGTKTYHRLATGVENNGFEMRDMIAWMYGGGMPKGLNVSKAIDKHLDKADEREVVEVKETHDIRGGALMEGSQPDIQKEDKTVTYKRTAPATNEAKEWDGWRTGLKPAFEPIAVAQKPKDGTFVENMLKWGVGALNINNCRISASNSDNGRFPANVIMDEDAGKLLNDQSGRDLRGGSRGYSTWDHTKLYGGGEEYHNNPRFFDRGGAARFFYCPKVSTSERNAGCTDLYWEKKNGSYKEVSKEEWTKLDKGNRSRGNMIVSLKPINLMRYLVRLVTPEGGTVLDPFAGSGTTAVACKIEGMNYILIEQRKCFVKISRSRVQYWSDPGHWSELDDHPKLPKTEDKKHKDLDSVFG